MKNTAKQDTDYMRVTCITVRIFSELMLQVECGWSKLPPLEGEDERKFRLKYAD